MAVSGLERVASPQVRIRLGAGWWRRFRLALIVGCRASQLDRELATGTTPQHSAVIGLRARRITAQRSRERVAAGLLRALGSAAENSPGFSAAVRPHRREVLDARIVLTAVAQRLLAPEAVTAHGVAMLQVLLTEGESPLYRPSEAGALGSRLRAAAAALEPADRCE
jgi:hypothetical protein